MNVHLQFILLQAQSKELDTDYRRLQQQYSRFSSEQTELVKQQKRNFQLYKEQKTNEIASLDGKNILCKLSCLIICILTCTYMSDKCSSNYPKYST